MLGGALARQAYQAGLAGYDVQGPADPVRVGLAGGLCRQADIESPWLQHWCRRLQIAPLYHRKVWEHCFILQALWEAGMMAPGRRLLGFAVGNEPLPALLAAAGAEVLATDLDSARPEAQAWRDTGQLSAEREALFHPHLVDRAEFDARVAHRAVDMNRIPPDLHGRFDAVWSSCSLEHLGSVEHGLAFIGAAMRCLRPGGVAVHTTEFNLWADQSGSLRTGSTVLFEEADIHALRNTLAASGYDLATVSLDRGGQVLDGFIDMPPFTPGCHWPAGLPLPPHLRAQFRGHVVTSLGLIVRRPPAAS